MEVTVNLNSVNNASYNASARADAAIELAKNLKHDPERDARLAKGECPMCYYQKGRIGGAAMTNRECGLCGKLMQFTSTNTDTVCQECAVARKLCRHCGGDINMKQRRKI
jgi:hypothetical protein